MQAEQGGRSSTTGSGAFPMTFRVATGKLKHGLLISGLLALVGLWLVFLAGPSVAHGGLTGMVTLMLAAGVALVAVRRAHDPRPQLVLDRDGVWFRDWGLDPVPWNQIADIGFGGNRLQGFAALELRDAEALLGRLTAEQRKRAGSNRLVRPPRLLVPNGALDAPLPDILAAIRAGLAHYGET